MIPFLKHALIASHKGFTSYTDFTRRYTFLKWSFRSARGGNRSIPFHFCRFCFSGEKSMQKISVLLVDDHEVVRAGIRALLSAEQDIQVIGEASTGHEGVSLARKMAPDVVVMDISMPELNGLEATRQIKQALPDTKVLVLSSYDDLDCVEAMIEAGIKGFLSKRSASDQLVEAVRSVRCGREFFSPEILKVLKERNDAAARLARPKENSFQLTIREAEVVQLIAEGLQNKEIASKLGISTKTVEKHRQGAMNKLNIHETAGLTRYAIKKGMVLGTRAG
jgi:DNA-binding NarL/FixJ family response regulator